MFEQPTVVKARYIKLVQDLLAKRAAAVPRELILNGLCEYLSTETELREQQKAAVQLSLLLVYYRTRGQLLVEVDEVNISNRSMLGLLRDYHEVYRVSAFRQAELLEAAWAQVLADIRAIPADELTAILQAYYSKAYASYSVLTEKKPTPVPRLDWVFRRKPDAVALKRLSLPANGQSAFTKRIISIVGEH